MSEPVEEHGTEDESSRKPPGPPCTVYVDDNYHYMDEESRYLLGHFEDCQSAKTACMKIVDEFLLRGYKPGVSWEDLYRGYMQYGEDPFIVTSDQECTFSAWDYAQRRCQELCQGESV